MMIKTSDGAELCAETFGNPADPAILLIGGAAASLDWWEDEFCRRVVAGGRFVIRYDNRDTGQSTSYPAGKPGYTGADLTSDAVAVLDGLGLDQAHLVGISMGGGIAQEVAVAHPARVLSLTLMSTSPAISGGPDQSSSLPPSSPRVKEFFTNPPPSPDWTDKEAVIGSFVDSERMFAGSVPVDEQRVRAIAGKAFDRTIDVEASQTNHWIVASGDPVQGRLGDISAPTLVLHGTEDPLFPFAHGEALANAIPGARLVALPGVGHQMPPPEVWHIVIPAILEIGG